MFKKLILNRELTKNTHIEHIVKILRQEGNCGGLRCKECSFTIVEGKESKYNCRLSVIRDRKDDSKLLVYLKDILKRDYQLDYDSFTPIDMFKMFSSQDYNKIISNLKLFDNHIDQLANLIETKTFCGDSSRWKPNCDKCILSTNLDKHFNRDTCIACKQPNGDRASLLALLKELYKERTCE